jgi:hypothetical protein
MFFVAKRATLLMASGPASDPDKKHLFICLTDSFGVQKETLVVSVSTFRQGLPADDDVSSMRGIIHLSST